MGLPRRAVVVVGMHRSGTSAITRLLHLCGLDIGDAETLAPAGQDNPTGYWESIPLREINEAILNRLGGTWIDPPAPAPGWAADSAWDELLARAGQRLTHLFAPEATPVFKDPRTSLLIPFWSRLLEEPRMVVCLRNPLSVADSLARRNGFPPFLGRDLWSEYTDAALWDTDTCSRVLVHFEDLMVDPIRQLDRIRQTFELDLDVEGHAAAIRTFVRSELQHHHSGLEDVEASPLLDPGTKELYRLLWRSRHEPGPISSISLYSNLAERLAGNVDESTSLALAARGFERRAGTWHLADHREGATGITARESVIRAHQRDVRRVLSGLYLDLATLRDQTVVLDERIRLLRGQPDAGQRSRDLMQNALAENQARTDAKHTQVKELTEHLPAQRRRSGATSAAGRPSWFKGTPEGGAGLPGTGAGEGPPSVGVVIVTYNSKEHIASCLDSLPVAASLRLNVVVVDNGSQDGTVGAAWEAWPGLRVIEEPQNIGFASAVNKAASVLTDCRYILLLNPDATMGTRSLEALVAALDASPRAAACGPHLRYPDGRHQISARPLPTLTGTIYDALLLYHLKSRPDLVEQFPPDPSASEVDCLSGACMLIRRECFDELHGLDEAFFLYGEDVDFCARLHDLGRSMLLVPAAEVIHVEGASAFKDRALFFREIHRANAQYVRKHFGPVKAGLAVAAQMAGLVVRGVLYPFGSLMGRPDLRSRARHQWTAIASVLRGEALPRRHRSSVD